MLIRVKPRYFGDTEVFRTSTEEPNQRGISYTYMKDMSQYMAMWRQPQKVIFDLPNSVTDVVRICHPFLNIEERTSLELIPFSVDRRLQHYHNGQLLQCTASRNSSRFGPHNFRPAVE